MKSPWNTVAEATKFAATVLAYSWAKDLPPNLDNQIVDSVIQIAVAIASALGTLLLINALFGRPKMQVEWIVGKQTPKSNRPELRERTGIFFRYSIAAETSLAVFALWLLRKYRVEARLAFAPSENIQIIEQYLRPASTKTDSVITTRFNDGLQKGNSCDGEFALRLKQGRSWDTSIECSITLHPYGASEGKWFAKLLCRWVNTDPIIEGFVLKGAA